MTVINDFIIANYSWILIIVIIILLAIIGSYADKTNFGEGKKSIKEEDNKKSVDLSNKKLSDLIPNSKNNENQEKIHNKNNNLDTNINILENSNKESVNSDRVSDINDSQSANTANVKQISKIIENDRISNIEDKLSELDKEIYGVLPKKDEFDSSILEELDDLSFDIKQSHDFKVKDEFDLDDLKLPEIKSLKDDMDDVWNYKY